MVLGMSVEHFTQFHVVLSLVGIIAGLVVVFSMLANRMSAAWTTVFLATTLLTSITGFPLPAPGLLPSHIVGLVSLVALAAALLALYRFRLAGSWRGTYVIAAVIALYLNCFVAVVQAFLKLGLLQSSGQLQGIAQGLLFVGFLVLGFRAWQRFRPS